jgi:hypothetical protein
LSTSAKRWVIEAGIVLVAFALAAVALLLRRDNAAANFGGGGGLILVVEFIYSMNTRVTLPLFGSMGTSPGMRAAQAVGAGFFWALAGLIIFQGIAQLLGGNG